MKKLLSLLSVLTISGTALPTVIAVGPGPYKKEETKLENSEINYLQTNNLENLNRIKRENRIHKLERKPRTIDSVNYEWNIFSKNYLFLYIDDVELRDLVSFQDIHGNDNDAFNNKIYRLIITFRNSRNVSLTDISTIANVVTYNFSNIKSVFLKNPNNGLIIRTNTAGYWENNDDWWGAHKDSN